MRLLFIIIFTSFIYAKNPKISFIAFENNKWRIIVCNGKFECKSIKTQVEPRTFDYNFKDNTLVYIGSDKNLRLIKDSNESIILKKAKNAYTQPSFIDSKNILLVELVNGNSKNTRFIKYNIVSKKINTIHSQYSTSLDPYIYKKDLYYANVSCVDGCGKIIEEIWHKDLVTNIANQLTLTNTLSFQPSISKKGILYFSSMNNNSYHIYKLNTKNNLIKQITFDNSVDLFPKPYKNGVLFIREKRGNYKLIYYNNGDIKTIPLDKKYKKIRDLKVEK